MFSKKETFFIIRFAKFQIEIKHELRLIASECSLLNMDKNIFPTTEAKCLLMLHWNLPRQRPDQVNQISTWKDICNPATQEEHLSQT